MCIFTIKTSIFSMFCAENSAKPRENTHFGICVINLSFLIFGLKIRKIQKSKNPRFSGRYESEFWIFGFLDFWIFGFLDSWIFGFLDFWILASTNLYVYIVLNRQY